MDFHRATRVDHRIRPNQAKLHRLRCRKDLKGGTQFINALHRAVKQRAGGAIGGGHGAWAIIWVKVGE